MPKIEQVNKPTLVFGSSSTQRVPVGQTADGSTTPSADYNALMGLDADWTGGLDAMRIGTSGSYEINPREIIAILSVLSYSIASIYQRGGMLEYNANIQYQIGDFAKDSTTQFIYRSLVDDNVANALTNPTYWERYYSLDDVLSNVGDLPYVNSSSEISSLSKGTANQILRVNSTNDDLEYADLYASNTERGIVRYATDTEYFNKATDVVATPAQIEADVRNASFSIGYNGDGLNIALPRIDTTLDGAGNFVEGYNLLQNFLAVDESRDGASSLVYKDIFNATQSTILQEQAISTDNYWLFPSTLHTWNRTDNYQDFRIRVRVNLTTNTGIQGNNVIVVIRLLRKNFNANNEKIVDSWQIKITDVARGTVLPQETIPVANTFVAGEDDPFVTGGYYMDIAEDITSTEDTGGVNLNPYNIRKFV